MKTARILALAFFSVAAFAQEKEPTLEEIVAQRGAILAQLLEDAKAGQKRGTSSAQAVHAAALELYAFRRDSAKTAAEKVDWQKRVVETEKEHAATCAKRIAVGVMTPNENLRAKERVLAAQQLLLELQKAK